MKIKLKNECIVNFPIRLLKNASNHIEETMQNIINYSTKTDGVKVQTREPMTGAKKSVIVSFMDNKKPIDEAVYFLAFLGIKSIVGKRQYRQTNKDFILARANGDKFPIYDIVDVNLFGTEKELVLDHRIKPYHNRKRFNKLRKVLGSKYHVSIASPKGTRGFYVSTRLTEKQLLSILESMKKK